MSGFPRDFQTLLDAYPRKQYVDAAFGLWCEMERRGELPAVDILVNSVEAEIEANGGKWLPGLEKWLREKKWLDTPSVDGVKKPKVYTDERGAPIAQPLHAAKCNCGGSIRCDHGPGWAGHLQRHCPRCGRNYPCGGNPCERKNA